MRQVIFIIITLTFAILACRPKQQTTATVIAEKQVCEKPKATGKVSHQYQAMGCETVIIIENEENPIILIPKSKLNEYDIDGLEICFSYRALRMPNPTGCMKGMPAEITEIVKR